MTTSWRGRDRVLDRWTALVTLVLVCLPGWWQGARGAEARAARATRSIDAVELLPDAPARLVPIGEQSGPAPRITEAEIAALRARHAAPRGGDGGAASVADLIAIQVGFKDSDCPIIPTGGNTPINVVLLIWDIPTPNTLGVDVYLDGILLGNVAAPTAQTFFTTADVPAGLHTFRIEETNEGTASEIDIEILDTQPMADARDLTVERGPTTVNSQTQAVTCNMVFRWKNICRVPDSYTVRITGTTATGQPLSGTIGGINSAIPRLNLSGLPSGTYGAEIIAFYDSREQPGASYRGCFVAMAAPFALVCDPELCSTPPTGILLTQIEYGGEAGTGTLELFFIPGQNNPSYSRGLNIYFDGVLFDPDADGVSFPNDGVNPLPTGLVVNSGPGPIEIGLQGDCGVDGQTAINSETFPVLAESPHDTPIQGPIVCTFDLDTASTTATWTEGDCSSALDVFLLEDPELDPLGEFVGRFPGNIDSVTVIDTFPEDRINLQFYAWSGTDDDLHMYGSDILTCNDDPVDVEHFIRGICNDGTAGGGGTQPQLTDGIFILNFLFQGGAAPGCVEACDSNDSGGLDLTDAVLLFQFLFLGGQAPSGWIDQSPTCAEITEDIDCAVPNPSCPLQ